MKAYDPNSPLISLHIPKCAGQSLRRVLQQWFDDRFFVHYFQQYNAPPPKHPLEPGICIHGHFRRDQGMGASDYYPTVDQFITILRDPLEMALSNYFFWKTKARYRQLRLGMIEEGGEHDYRNIDDFFLKRPRSTLLNFIHDELNFGNYQESLENKFVWIGLAEEIQASVEVLANRLGFVPVSIGHINASPRDETLSPDIAERFIESNQLELEIYRYVKEKYHKG